MMRKLYLSEVKNTFSPDFFRKNYDSNALAKILSGFVCHSRDRLLFCIEGKRIEVKSYLKRLESDDKLKYIYALDISRLGGPLFQTWETKYISHDKSYDFQFEHYVEQHLLYIKNNISSDDRNLRFIWTSLSLISKNSRKHLNKCFA